MTGTGEITILTVDDHPLIREGLAVVIGREPDMRIVAEAGDGEEAIERYREHRPAIVLMDLRMPVMNGVEAIQALREEFPDARIIALTTYEGDEDIYQALASGASGYLLKDTMRTELVSVIRAVHRGYRGIPPNIAAKLAEHTPRIALTPRELEVLRLMAEGKSNSEIASALGRAEGTMKIHVRNILSKLGATDRTQAVTIALRRGILHLD
ncbi:MAG TPA: response regulator transcription factor [Gemmatimonadales bacterium]|nr:response regulator transcription factor [Gemmatimonadales bacterium]